MSKRYNCQKCNKDFANKQSFEMHHLNKHLNREEAAQFRARKTRNTHLLNKSISAVVVLTVVALLYWGFTSINLSPAYSSGQVHWHADLELFVCGENIPLPSPLSTKVAHGQSYIGTPLMHSHGGTQIHVEGTVSKAKDITLGKFMTSLGLDFTQTQLLDKSNGDFCGDTEGKVKLFVNGIDSDTLSDEVIVDDRKYEIRFE
jgi:hypothetical protein